MKRLFDLAHSSRNSVPFIVFELFFHSLNCRKLVVMQMILVHRNASDFSSPGDTIDYFPVALDPFFVSVCNSFQHSCSPPLLEFSFELLRRLTDSPLISELHKALALVHFIFL